MEGISGNKLWKFLREKDRKEYFFSLLVKRERKDGYAGDKMVIK